MDEYNAYIGLDIPKKTISVAIAEAGRNGECRSYGTIGNTPEQIRKLAAKLTQRHGAVHFVYEAGPTGYVPWRTLVEAGYACAVIGPAQIPKKPGDRVKTDRRDALQLARLDRAGELEAIWVPDEHHEAIRDLVRAREQAVQDLRRARQQVSSFLLRQGRSYNGATWTKMHRRWLARLQFDQPAHKVVLDTLLQAVDQARERRDLLTREISGAVPAWKMAPVVEALKALRGVSLVAAAGIVAEIGDIARFAHPAQLMAYLGLVSSEHSSGEKRRPGALTKTGSPLARKLLTEAAWSYRHTPKVSEEQLAQQDDLPQGVRDHAWKAQTRLYARYRALLRAGKKPQIAIIAIARELVGFIWAIALQARPA